MAMPSTSDGNNVEDVFYGIANSNELPPLLGTSPTGPPNATMPPAHLMWQNQLMGAHYLHPQPTQAHLSDYLYNVHSPAAAYAPPGAKQETYSVLPVGPGNFLKVYHCQEPSVANIPGDNALFHHHQHPHHQQQPHPQHHPQQQQQQPQHFQQQQQQQQQTQLQFHHQPQQSHYPLSKGQQKSPAQQFFNSYELFSSTSLIPPTDKPKQFETDRLNQNHPNPLLVRNEVMVNDDVTQSSSSASLIINKLVNNWSPNPNGGTYSQFGSPMPNGLAGSSMSDVCNQSIVSAPDREHKNTDDVDMELENAQTAIVSEEKCNMGGLMTTALNHSESCPQLQAKLSLLENEISHHGKMSNEVLTPEHGTGTFLPEVKKRIIAEVKPMRMTYSDVLSKFNNQQTGQRQQIASAKINASKMSKVPNSSSCPANDRRVDCNIGTTTTTTSKRSTNFEENQTRNPKRSPTHELKDTAHQQPVNLNNKCSKRLTISSSSNQAINNISQQKVVNQTKSSMKITGENKKRNSSKSKTEVEPQFENSKTTKVPTDATSDKDFNGFYNVRAKNQDSARRSTKLTQNNTVCQAASPNSTCTTSVRKANRSSNYYSNSSSSGNNQSRGRFNHTNNSAYSYSSKRNRSHHNAGYVSSDVEGSNPNIELAKKFLRTWFEYTIKILHWLFYLIYDIVVLGFSRVYEQLIVVYEHSLIYGKQFYKDFKQNSDKPSIWLKEFLHRVDGKFKKTSKWAIWRRFYKKRPPDAGNEPFKNGRLPQTGEEAMFSLLNCKGKDAYSILGVPPDSSQEQIRKHYKKIAVLVHPDKNKQAGAEEAFKVLQRAFELIGEPENRRVYDQSLAEALHAEKAWTELHDLLSQLQTKITEAANTIRCSTCGLRHPRKLTDRPYFAARECVSCKIRHTAREGDIWAETSFLGLRWKYLALMEGKVYDITEWANCQKGALSHLEPNSHMVQYRIVRGAQQTQQSSQNRQQNSPHRQGSNYRQSTHAGSANAKYKRDFPSDDSLHDFLDNLYSGQQPTQSNSSNYSNSSRRRTRRN